MKKLLFFTLLTFQTIAFAQAKYCYTDSYVDKKINTCDPAKIQALISANGSLDNPEAGVVTLFERINPTTLQMTIIYPKDRNPKFGEPGKILVSKWGYVVSGGTYVDTDKDGCTERGLYKEDKETITITPKLIGDNCNAGRKGFFQFDQNKAKTYRKIPY